MYKNLGPKILELHKSGLSYNEIIKLLNCSKGTVAYYCGSNQKEKTYNRTKKRRKNTLVQKLERFQSRNEKNKKDYKLTSIKIQNILNAKIKNFSKGDKRMFSLTELINKIGDNPKCYLTGRDINLSNGRSYHLDHIVPVSKGGNNSLENCNIACREANQAKSDMTLDEFYKLCEEVCKNKT